jgi:hypothetical protein
MKKLIALLIILCLIGVSAAADGALSIGTELVIPNLEYADVTTTVRPFIGYEKIFDTGINIFLELGVPVSILKGWYGDGTTTTLGLDINLGVTYNLETSETSKLDFTFQTWAAFPLDDEKGVHFVNEPIMDLYEYGGWGFEHSTVYLDLGIEFTQTLGFGDLFFGIDMPFFVFQYAYGNFNPYLKVFDIAMLNITFGTETTGGFGGGLTLYNEIGRWHDVFFMAYHPYLTYRTEFFLGRLIFEIPFGGKEAIKDIGFGIVPEFEFSVFNGLSFFGSLPIRSIGTESSNHPGVEDNPIYLGLRVGAKYSF